MEIYSYIASKEDLDDIVVGKFIDLFDWMYFVIFKLFHELFSFQVELKNEIRLVIYENIQNQEKSLRGKL